jgi:hypothetical protein
VDHEVAKTLGELELKLQELERELTTIGRRDGQGASEHPHGRLVDEAVEHESAGNGSIEIERRAAEAGAGDREGDGFGGPAVFGGEEVPAQAGATIERDWTVEARETAYGEIPTPPAMSSSFPDPSPPIPPPSPTPQPQPPTTPPGPPPPTTPPSPQPPETPPGTPAPGPGIDLVALRSFRDKLASTMDALVEEYSRLLSVEETSRRGPGS